MEGLDVKLTTTTDFVQNTENVNLTIKFVFNQSKQDILYDTNFVEVIIPKIRDLVTASLDEFDALHTLQRLRTTPFTTTTEIPTPTTQITPSESTTTTATSSVVNPEVWGQLRRVSFSHHFQNVTCGCCHQNLIQNEFYRTVPVCKHTFHKRCIDRWVLETRGMTCPTCHTTSSSTSTST